MRGLIAYQVSAVNDYRNSSGAGYPAGNSPHTIHDPHILELATGVPVAKYL